MKMLFLILLCSITVFVGCTQQQRAKTYGGTATVDLPKGQKLVTATWKETHLWYLTRPMRAGEEPETFTFAESSDYGLIQGKVVFRESN